MGSACRFTGIQHRDVINDFQKPPFSSIYIIHECSQQLRCFKNLFRWLFSTNTCGGEPDQIKISLSNKNEILFRERFAKPPNIIQKLQSNFHFNSDNLKQIFKLPHSIVVESYVKAFQYKVINSILYTNTKLYKIGFRTNDLCTFCDNQPESLIIEVFEK